MKKLIFSLFIVATVFCFGAAAQTAVRESFEKGMILADGGKYEAARAAFKTALAFSAADAPKNDFLAKIRFNIGVCQYRLKNYEESAAELEQAVKLDRNYEKAFYALGMTHAELENWPKAENAFLRAIALNRRSGEAWFDLAFVYLAQDNLDAARAAFEKAIEHKSVAAAVGHNNLGVIYAVKGDFAAAVRKFETAVRTAGGSFPEAERNLSFCKSLAKNLRPALSVKLEIVK